MSGNMFALNRNGSRVINICNILKYVYAKIGFRLNHIGYCEKQNENLIITLK